MREWLSQSGKEHEILIHNCFDTDLIIPFEFFGS